MGKKQYRGLENSRKALDRWKRDVLNTVRDAEIKSLTRGSGEIMQSLVENAQYNDFTGDLNASYIAAIYNKGRYIRKTADSLEYADTQPISAHKGEVVPLRNKRMPTKRKSMKALTTHYGRGFAHRRGKLKNYNPRGEIALAITNAAPYAEAVQGKNGRRVMYGRSVNAGTFVEILKEELKKSKKKRR